MSRRPRIDLSFGPGHGAVSGTLNAAGAALGGTMLLDLGRANPLWGLATGAALAAVGVLVAYGQPARVLFYRSVCWLAAGFWSTWTLSGFRGVPIPWTGIRLLESCWAPGTPWAMRPTYGLLTGAAVAAAVGSGLELADKRRAAQAAARAAAAEAASAAAEADRVPVDAEEEIAFAAQPVIRRITKKPITILNVERWEPEYGYTLDCELPNDGTTISDIKPCEEALAYALDLPEGCGVEIMRNEGLGRRAILIKVTTVSALGDDIPLPRDYGPETVENPIAIGVHTDRAVAEVPLRYESVVLVGNTDSGKSNQLNVLVAGLGRCTDVLLCGIDLSGKGRFLRPWVRAYAEGRAPRPVFGYVATDDVQAALLCTALIQIIDGRTADYAELMHREGTDKIMPRPTLPQLILVIDEFGKLPEAVKDMIKTITDTGRGAAVRVVSCALEATATYIPRAIITQSRVRIGMRVVDEAQLHYLFDTTWRRGRFDPASLPWKGSGLYTVGPRFPDRFKGYRVTPAQVDEIAVAVGPLRPRMDEASLRRGDTVTIRVAGPDGYRIERTFHNVLTGNESDTYPQIFPATAMAGTAGAGPSREDPPAMNTPPGDTGPADLGAAVRDLGSALDRARQAADDADAAAATGHHDGSDQRPGSVDDPTVAALNAMLAMPSAVPDRPSSAGDTPPTERPAVPPRRRVRQLIVEAAERGGIGPGDIHATLVAEGYPTSLTTISNWLRAWKAAGVVDQPGGDRTPWLPGPEMDT
jgi:S-DNA-T family DNA segregation ATPase FtsK/SpoIIIE